VALVQLLRDHLCVDVLKILKDNDAKEISTIAWVSPVLGMENALTE